MTFVPPNGFTTSTHVFDEWARAELLERRIVWLRGELDDVTAGHVASQLMLLDASGDDEITLRIDSAGGSLAAAAALVDTIDALGVPVHALATRAEGPAVAVLAVCDHRAVTPHATLRLLEPKVRFDGPAAVLTSHLEHYQKSVQSLWTRISEACRLTPAHVADEFGAGRYLSPDDAIAFGLVDEIATPPADIQKLRRPMGFQPPQP